jgi:hypothetical protein
MKTNKISLKKQIKHLLDLISMKCLDCTCCQPKEIILCEIEGCPLWEKRPLKTKGLYTLVKRLKQKNPGLYEAKE